MKSCTFFGHKICASWVFDVLKETIIDMIENKGVNRFYVGNNGDFDCSARRVLKELKIHYPNIIFYVVPAYLRELENLPFDYETIIPDGIENIIPRFAICYRNEWMIERSQYVIAYVEGSIGGAYKYMTKALKKKRTVINLANKKP